MKNLKEKKIMTFSKSKIDIYLLLNEKLLKIQYKFLIICFCS